MKLRLYSVALVSLLLTLAVWSVSAISLNKRDFVSAEILLRDGITMVSAKLSESGKLKFKELNASSVIKEIHTELGGVSSNLHLRGPIVSDALEMGPHSKEEAQKIITEINQE